VDPSPLGETAKPEDDPDHKPEKDGRYGQAQGSSPELADSHKPLEE